MKITLGAEFEKRIQEMIDSGRYTCASEVMRDALCLLFEKDDSKQQLNVLRSEVAKAVSQLSAGEYSSKNVLDIFDEVAQNLNSDSIKANVICFASLI